MQTIDEDMKIFGARPARSSNPQTRGQSLEIGVPGPEITQSYCRGGAGTAPGAEAGAAGAGVGFGALASSA